MARIVTPNVAGGKYQLNAKEPEPVEPVEISMRYFYIKTERFEQFLTELNKLCEKFAVKNERQQPDFSYDWDAI